MKKLVSIALSLAVLLTGCTQAPNQPTKVVLIAHDSFAISDESIALFEQQSGFELEIIRAGDAGSLTNRLVLTKGSPIADVVFGIDNTFSGIALNNGVIDQAGLIEVDYSDVCFNYDRYYFEQNQLTPPQNWQELILPQYKGLTVITNPLSSSPGMAFLVSTVATFGPAHTSWWQSLRDNDVKVASGWEEAYFTDFSGSAGAGDYPIVLSYSSSPAAEIREDGKSQTAALLSDCFRQIEYIGVLEGANNKPGAQALIEFLLGRDFQATMPDLMYVYPVNPEVEIPAQWATFGPPAISTVVYEYDIEAMRELWQSEWLAVFE
jgi:thiamine transport system substrate-binding protein